MSTKIRSSSQLYIDDNLQFNGKKGIGLTAGSATGDSVEFDQLNTAISNAVSGVGNSIHVPVADLAAGKAIVVAGRADKMLMLIESLGLYHFDAESVAVSNDGTVIRPTDVATDAVAGRWIKMSSILTDHALLDNILGNGSYHLSLAERNKLTGIEDNADVTDKENVGAAFNAAPVITPADTDFMASVTGAVLGKTSWLNVKVFLKIYFDTLYNKYVHPNHTGDVTSVADGAQTITAKAVTNAKLADMAINTIKGSVAGGVPIDLTKAQALGILNVEDGADVTDNTNVAAAIAAGVVDAALADTDYIPVHSGTLGKMTITTLKAFLKLYTDTLYNKYIHPNHSGDVTSVADGAQTITANAVTNAKAAQMAAYTIKGNNTAAGANAADLTKTQVLALLNVADGANAYVHPNHSGDVSSTGDGATVIGANKVDNAKLAAMGANTVKGSVAGGNAADLTVAQLRTMLGLIVGTNLSQRYFRATPAGLVNSSNAVFTIAALVISGTEEVFKNGLLMNAGAGNDYTITYGATTTITFITAPSGSGYADVILVNYSV